MPLDTAGLKQIIRDIPDFPKKGIIFKDITPLLQNPEAFACIIDSFASFLEAHKVDIIVGIESRGFIFSPALAYKLHAGFVPVRKKGKLPWLTHQVAYDLEYGQAVLEIHRDAFPPGTRVAIVDDLLATGGTAEAAIRLVETLGGEVCCVACVIELTFLKGRERLGGHDFLSLVQY